MTGSATAPDPPAPARTLRTFALGVLMVAAVAAASDEALKIAVRAALPVCHPPYVGFTGCPGLRLVGQVQLIHVENPGTGSALFRTAGEASVLGIVALLAVMIYALRLTAAGWPGWAGAGLQLGGVFGNLVDHVTSGSVTDMLHLAPRVNVNLADIYLVVGAALVLVAFGRVLTRSRTDRAAPP